MKRTLSAALALLLAGSSFAQAPAAGLLKIGTAAAVRGAVKAVSSGSPVGHVISSGKPLFQNDRVTTDAAGRLQVLLLDETVFTLGPNSDMVLDDFVFDPKTSAGSISATVSKGTFRFVTGKIAQKDPSKMKIKVAVGTIGVRGSIGVCETGPGGTTVINAGAFKADNHDDAAGIYGENGGKVVNLQRPGAGTRMTPDGRIEAAHFMTGELNRIMGTLQLQVGRNGGNGNGGAQVTAGHKSATDASGRGTAVGGLLATDSLVSADLVSTLDSTLATTIQGINTGVQSTWGELQGINTGVGSYSGSGSVFCSGGACGSGANGTFTFSLGINFASQDIVGTGANSLTISIPGAFLSDQSNITSFSYTGLSGAAKGTLTPVNSAFNGTAFSLADRASTIAKDMTVSLKWTTSGSPAPVATGNATGSR